MLGQVQAQAAPGSSEQGTEPLGQEGQQCLSSGLPVLSVLTQVAPCLALTCFGSLVV